MSLFRPEKENSDTASQKKKKKKKSNSLYWLRYHFILDLYTGFSRRAEIRMIYLYHKLP